MARSKKSFNHSEWKKAVAGAAKADAGPNSQKYEVPFEYQCTNGHIIGASKPIEVCPSYIHGSPCAGTLVRFGKGSGTGSHFKKVEA